MSDQSHRPQTTPAPVVDAPAVGPATSQDKRLAASGSGGGGNAFAASMARPPAAETPGGPGLFDRLGALTGSTHIKTLMGKSGEGVTWDDTDKSANHPNVDRWGKDRIRVPKLRISSIQTAALSAKAVSADGIDLNERDKTKEGKYAADLVVPTASAKDLASTSPAIKAAGVDLAGVKVQREFVGDTLTDFFTSPGTTAVEVATAKVTGLSGGGAEAGALTATGLTGSSDGTNAHFAATTAHADRLSAHGASATTADARGLKGAVGAEGNSLSATTFEAGGVAAGGARFVKVSTHGLSVKAGASAVSASAAQVDVAGASGGDGFAIQSGTATDATLTSTAETTALGAKGVRMDGLAGGGVTATSAEFDNASVAISGGLVSAAADRSRATGVNSAAGGMGQVASEGTTFATKDGDTRMTSTSLQAADLNAGGMHLDQAHAQGLSVGIGAGRAQVGIDAVRGSGFQTAGVKAAGLSAAGVTIDQGDKLRVGAKSASATDVSVGGVHTDRIDGGDLTTTVGAGGAATTTGTAGSLKGTGIRSGQTSLADLSVTGGTYAAGADSHAFGAGSASAHGFTGPDLSLTSATAKNAKVRIGTGSVDATADKLGATDLKAGQVKAAKLSATGAKVRSAGDDINASATTATASKLTAGSVSIADTQAQGLEIGLGPRGVRGGVGSAQLSGVSLPGVSAETAKVGGAKIAIDGGSTTASAETLSATSLKAAGATAKSANAKGVTLAQNAATGTTSASAASAGATGLSHQIGATRTTADAITSGKLTHKQTGDHSTTESAGLSAQGLNTSTTTEGTGADSDLTRQVGGLVGSADLKASVPLNPQTTGSGTKKMTVKPGTTAFVEVQVRSGKLVPANTKASFSKPLDTWGWTSVPGVYMSPDGKLYASVDGLWDSELTDAVNKSLGQNGDVVPLRVSDLLASKPAPGGGPAMADMSELKVKGSVGLTRGTLESGGMSATLGAGQGANVAQVDKDGDRSLSVAFSKLLLDAFGVESGGTTVDVKNVQATGVTGKQVGDKTTAGAASVTTGKASLTR